MKQVSDALLRDRVSLCRNEQESERRGVSNITVKKLGLTSLLFDCLN